MTVYSTVDCREKERLKVRKHMSRAESTPLWNSELHELRLNHFSIFNILSCRANVPRALLKPFIVSSSLLLSQNQQRNGPFYLIPSPNHSHGPQQPGHSPALPYPKPKPAPQSNAATNGTMKSPLDGSISSIPSPAGSKASTPKQVRESPQSTPAGTP